MKKKIAVVLIPIIILLCACGSDDSNTFAKVMGVTDFNKAIKILGEPDSEEKSGAYYNFKPFLGKTGSFHVELRYGELFGYSLKVFLSDENFPEYEKQCVDYFTEKYGQAEYREPDKYFSDWEYTWNISDKSNFRVSCWPKDKLNPARIIVSYTP